MRIVPSTLVILCLAFTGNSAGAVDGISYISQLPSFGGAHIALPSDMAAHIEQSDHPLCQHIVSVSGGAIIGWMATARREENVALCSSYIVQLLNRALSDGSLPGATERRSGLHPEEVLRANYSLLVEHFAAYLHMDQSMGLQRVREQQAAWGLLHVYQSAGGKEVRVDAATGAIVGVRLPYGSTSMPALAQEQAVGQAERWLTACGIDVSGMSLSKCLLQERAGRVEWSLCWLRVQDGVVLPKSVSVRMSANGILLNVFSVDQAVVVSLEPNVSRQEAIAMTARYLPGEEDGIDAADLKVWYDDQQRQCLLWTIVARKQGGVQVVVLDAHSGAVIYVAGQGGYPADSPQDSRPRPPLPLLCAAVALLAFVITGLVYLRWRKAGPR